jgi:hypothetical protein
MADSEIFAKSFPGFTVGRFTPRLAAMKKVIRILVVLVILLIVAVVAVGFFLGSIVKKGVETAGPKVAKVEVRLDSASLSLLSGRGTLKGFLVGNPPDFKSPSAIQAGEISLAVQPRSVFSDKVVIQSVRLIAPEITLQGVTGDNLKKILENIQASTGGASTNKPAKGETAKSDQGGKKVQVDDFLIQDAKLRVVLFGGAVSPAVTLPEIHFTNLGQGPEGITPAELGSKVLGAVYKEALAAAPAAVKAAADLGKNAVKTVEDTGKKLIDGVKNPFQK